MKRTDWLNRGTKRLKSGKPLRRKTRLKARGGSMFPHMRQPEFMRWMYRKMKEGPRPCDGCGRWRWTVRAHLDPKGNGAPDLGNVALICDGPGDTCHRVQEKDTERFCERSSRDLYQRAREYEREYTDSLR